MKERPKNKNEKEQTSKEKTRNCKLNTKVMLIIIAFVLLIIIVFVTGFFYKNNKEKNIEVSDTNIQNGLLVKEIEIIENIEALEFSNVCINSISEMEYELTADVFNISKNILEAKTINIIVSDDDTFLYEVFGGNMQSIMPGEKILLSAKIRKNITATSKVQFEIIENGEF